MATEIADRVKAEISDLKAKKEFIKVSSQAQIVKIEARIAELQRLLTTIDADTEALFKILGG